MKLPVKLEVNGKEYRTIITNVWISEDANVNDDHILILPEGLNESDCVIGQSVSYIAGKIMVIGKDPLFSNLQWHGTIKGFANIDKRYSYFNQERVMLIHKTSSEILENGFDYSNGGR